MPQIPNYTHMQQYMQAPSLLCDSHTNLKELEGGELLDFPRVLALCKQQH